MKVLNTPSASIPYIDRHRAIVRAKHNTTKGEINKTKQNLLTLDSAVASRYTNFELAIQNNQLFNFIENDFLKQNKDDLLSCYNGYTKKVEEIFDLIKDAQVSCSLKKCPYCGITIPKTHDHYLPETKFPELAVHALNLIPCCFTCNQTKNDNWKNSTHRTFIYFYSDTIPVERFINVQLYFSTNGDSIGAKFSINKPPNFSDDHWDIISSHYDKLSLIDNYNEIVNDEITEIFQICLSHIRNGGVNLNNFILGLVRHEESTYGGNHWKVILLNALAGSPRFKKMITDAA